MAADHPAMAHLDQLFEHMQQALKDQDWEPVKVLNIAQNLQEIAWNVETQHGAGVQ
ncbi:hypothetical protein [Marinobacter gelidimuriae]|uniref:hypothetical protein n=1 Tax=Marinobacter gelidimuriae TaxID=2739064 RepID=UPI00036EEBB5|nr:hypothetical protein [Marinobacter gelidimuriae]